MRTKESGNYQIHPALVAFREVWLELGFKTGLPIADQFHTLWASAIILYRPLSSGDDVGSALMIVGPLLPVLSWPSPIKPPPGQRLIPCGLSDGEVEQHLAGEWLRLMTLLGEPRLIECSRRIFNRVLTDEQRLNWFQKKRLSQDYWARVCGVSREQLAHAQEALSKPRQKDKKNGTVSVPEPNFFLQRLADE